MKSSIQSRLTFSLTAAAILLSAGVGFILHHAIGAILIRQFDHTLQDKARGLSLLVSRELNGRLEFEYAPAAMPEYQRTEHAEYFEIQFTDGRFYQRSKSLGNVILPKVPPDGATHNLILPNGRTGRLVCMEFSPRPEDEIEPLDRPLSQMPTLPAGQTMVITLARDRAELDGGLRELNECLVTGALGLALVTAMAAIWIVRRALAPLLDVAEQAANIDAGRLDRRFPESSLPSELAPICTRLNDLLSRLQEAFQRERRFTADVAHELRTPIAELRSVTDIAMKWPEDVACVRHAVVDANAIAIQMEKLVIALLALVRSARPHEIIAQPASVHLASELRRVFDTLFSERKRNIDMHVPENAFVLADPTLLGSVLTNLLSNAIEYALGGTIVRCRALEASGRWQLSIDNETCDLNQEDVKHLFEPFWRKDHARTDTAHTGLGLSLVAEFCKLMDVQIVASIPEPSVLRMTLNLPVAAPGNHITGSARYSSTADGDTARQTVAS